ncbi:MAG: hypothetical protein KJO07_10000 [Deltaproteobacteria bacterium]|jgi:hypothetical protein|nr:hypothetical protein [Deltaproteobacteria bacterium]
MRFLLSLILAAGLSACDSPDISDNDPISVIDGDAAPDGDGGPLSDGGPTGDGAVPDGGLSAGQLFCDRYDMVCGYGAAAQNYDDENDCLATYATLTPDRVSCVNDALDNVECSQAAGKPPCN